MRKPGKVLLWIAGVVVVLGIAATVALKLYLTKERILAWVLPPLEATLHRKVSIEDAGAGFTGIHLDGLDVRAQDAAEPLLSARTLRIRWNLWALLSAKVEVDEVRLVAPGIRVVRRPDGTLDIDDLLRPGGAAKERGAPPGAGEPQERKGGGMRLAVQVGTVAVEKGRVTFEDRTQAPPRVYTLDAIELRVTDIALDQPFRYELGAQLPLAKAGRFSAAGTVDPGKQDVTAKVRIEGFDLPSLNPLLGEGTRMASGVFGLDLDLELGGGGKADVKGSVSVAKLALASREGSGKPFDVSIRLDTGAQLPQGTAVLRELDVTAAEQTVRMRGKATGLKARPRIEFSLDSPEIRTDAFLALLPPAPKEEQPKKAAQGPAAKPPSIPLDAFGDVRVGRLVAAGQVIEKFAARLSLDKGVLRIEPAKASLYGGTLDLNARAELEEKGPPFRTGIVVKGSQVGEVLAGLSPKLKGTMTGVLTLSLDASGEGGDLSVLRSQLRAEAKDGKLLAHPMVLQLARLFQVKELETLNFYSLKMAMETAKGVGQLASLVLDGPNLRATGKGTVGLIDHTVDMDLSVAVPRQVAAGLLAKGSVLDAVTDKDGWARLPIKLGGTLDRPTYGLDAKALTRGAAKAVGGKVEKALEDQVLKKLPVDEQQKGLVEEGLKKFLGR